MSRVRPAQIVAETVVVLCPYCGAEQPNPENGGDSWLPSEVAREAAMSSTRKCVSCDEIYRLHEQNRVNCGGSP